MIDPNMENHAEDQDSFEYQSQENVLRAEDGINQEIDEADMDEAYAVGAEGEYDASYMSAVADGENLQDASRAAAPSYELHLDDEDVDQPE